MKVLTFLNNDEGVSPIVATLVLIVVAIIGAAAVALIMGSFSSNVANQASTGNTALASSTTLDATGAGSMIPVISQIAAMYDANTTGVQVNVVGGNVSGVDTDVGFVSVEQKIADMGLINEGTNAALYTSQCSAYPNLKSYQVGASGVVFVTYGGPGAYTTITKADLTYLYTNGIPSGNTWTDHYGNVWRGVVGRSDPAAPMDIGMAYIGLNYLMVQSNPNIIGEQASCLPQVVAENPGYIGVMNAEDVTSNKNLAILAIDDQANSKAYTPTTTTGRTACDNIINEIVNNPSSATWPTGLIRQLNLMTNGPATPLALNFIRYVQAATPANQAIFMQNNEVHVSQVNSAFLK